MGQFATLPAPDWDAKACCLISTSLLHTADVWVGCHAKLKTKEEKLFILKKKNYLSLIYPPLPSIAYHIDNKLAQCWYLKISSPIKCLRVNLLTWHQKDANVNYYHCEHTVLLLLMFVCHWYGKTIPFNCMFFLRRIMQIWIIIAHFRTKSL